MKVVLAELMFANLAKLMARAGQLAIPSSNADSRAWLFNPQNNSYRTKFKL